jgi:hypothetical protein
MNIDTEFALCEKRTPLPPPFPEFDEMDRRLVHPMARHATSNFVLSADVPRFELLPQSTPPTSPLPKYLESILSQIIDIGDGDNIASPRVASPCVASPCVASPRNAKRIRSASMN